MESEAKVSNGHVKDVLSWSSEATGFYLQLEYPSSKQ